MSSKIAVVFLPIVILFFAFVCSSVHAEGEVLPWGVERIRAYCVWDNNRDMVVDNSSYTGQYVIIAVIDSGIDYYVDDWDKYIITQT